MARANGRVVATQGLLLVPFVTVTGSMLTAKGEDTLVDPEFWDRDALSGLWATLADYCRSRQIPFAWGFNGRKNSFKRVGFSYSVDEGAEFLLKPITAASVRKVVEGTRHARRHLDRTGGPAATWLAGAVLAGTSRIRETLARAPFARNRTIQIETTQLDGIGLEHLAHRLVTRYGGSAVARTPSFLKHRLLNNPFVRSTLLCARTESGVAGAIAYAIDPSGQAHITDIVVAPEDPLSDEAAVAAALLDAVIDRARGAGAAVLRMTSFNRHPSARMLRAVAGRLGFFARPTVNGACIKPMSGEIASGFAQFQHWFVTGLNTEGRQG